MENQTLAAALEREHREIDGGIEAYAAQLPGANAQTEPLERAIAGLKRHIYLEEEFLFPPLREAGMTMPIFVMLREHGDLWNAMSTLEALLGGEDANAVRDACRDLLSKLDAHNSKEEPIIYAQADRVLDAGVSDELHEFLNEGRMPEGWVCAGAK